MKKHHLVAAPLLSLLIAFSAFAENHPRTRAQEPVSIQLSWVTNSSGNIGTYFYVVPPTKTLVVETVSARVVRFSIIETFSSDRLVRFLPELPHELRLSIDRNNSFFVPMTFQGYCDETGFECGDAPRPIFVGVENVRLYVEDELVGNVDPAEDGTIIHLLISGYLLPKGSAPLGP